jgi:glycosyltransferase involved in cell wall biosynthesis
MQSRPSPPQGPKLRIAIVKDGETFPHLCAPWTLRIGNLAREMARRGHQVTWYSSTFMHNEKELYAPEETVEEREEGYRMHLLHAGTYQKNISWARWLHHARLAWRLYPTLRAAGDLDVVVCCIPILECAAACMLFCKQHRVPLVLDIQDPWPQTFVTHAPPSLRPLVRTVLAPYFYGSSQLFGRADSLVACSAGFLNWAQRLGRRPGERCSRDRVIYHGAHQAAAQIPPDPMVPTRGLRSIYMGAFGGIYNLEPIAELAEAQAARGDDHHFFLVGQGGERYQRLKARLEGLPNVTFTGWMPREAVYALARTCHLGWLPLDSDTEDFLPNKPFEYAALGLAVATSSSGESGRLVTEHGLGFRYDTLAREEFLARVCELTPESEQLRQWRQRGQEFSRLAGDAQVCIEQFGDHVERVAACSRGEGVMGPASGSGGGSGRG